MEQKDIKVRGGLGPVVKNTAENNPDFPKISPYLDMPVLVKTLRRKKLGLMPRERILLKNYILANGKIRVAAKNSGVPYSYARHLLTQPKIRKALSATFKKLGIGYTSIVGVLKRVMYRQGDYHYDFNRMKAIDMYLRLTGTYAPIKMKLDGEMNHNNRAELKVMLQKLLKVIDVSAGDTREHSQRLQTSDRRLITES